jgi:uncharacterized protein YkwD
VLAATFVAAPDAAVARACESASAIPAKKTQRAAVRATLCKLNAARERHDLKPLKLNRRLSNAARRHSRDMVRRGYFAHDSPGGATVVDRIRRSGYLRGASSWTVGENLAWGTRKRSTPRAITKGWMNSAGHRANILSPSFRDIGIGVALGAPGATGGPAATYTTDFGSRD